MLFESNKRNIKYPKKTDNTMKYTVSGDDDEDVWLYKVL